VSSNFWELVSKNVEPIMTIINLAQLRGEYISITLVRNKDKPFIISFQKHKR